MQFTLINEYAVSIAVLRSASCSFIHCAVNYSLCTTEIILVTHPSYSSQSCERGVIFFFFFFSFFFFFEPTCANAQRAHMHRFPPSVCSSLDQKYWEKIHISKSIAPRVMDFGHSMNVDDLKGHRSKVKVTRSKNAISYIIL